MRTAQLITHGKQQSVCLPEEFHIEGTEVYVKRLGNAVLLLPKNVDPWDVFSQALDRFTPDFMEERNQPKGQECPA